jgi:hypothetical protein
MIDDYEAISGMRISRGNRSTRRKSAPVQLCPPQIPYDLSWARTQTASMGSRRLTAWAMARLGTSLTWNRSTKHSNGKLGWISQFLLACDDSPSTHYKTVRWKGTSAAAVTRKTLFIWRHVTAACRCSFCHMTSWSLTWAIATSRCLPSPKLTIFYSVRTACVSMRHTSLVARKDLIPLL